ncbi:hypothetical protein L6452_42555 [Arctium lappa]|uniref:Uncharacterized protein n=1 Tax=Arctium lappa TaxID=4217 RepID=A0ACB8XJ66_ARCLA|nr:hypothetical protein L6452_42555 [Arctium lappa]
MSRSIKKNVPRKRTKKIEAQLGGLEAQFVLESDSMEDLNVLKGENSFIPSGSRKMNIDVNVPLHLNSGSIAESVSNSVVNGESEGNQNANIDKSDVNCNQNAPPESNSMPKAVSGGISMNFESGVESIRTTSNSQGLNVGVQLDQSQIHVPMADCDKNVAELNPNANFGSNYTTSYFPYGRGGATTGRGRGYGSRGAGPIYNGEGLFDANSNVASVIDNSVKSNFKTVDNSANLMNNVQPVPDVVMVDKDKSLVAKTNLTGNQNTNAWKSKGITLADKIKGNSDSKIVLNLILLFCLRMED